MSKVSVVFREWTESEAGWGCRSDGFSLHLNIEAAKAYEKAYWDRMPKNVPHEYSRPERPELLDVHPEVHALLKAKAEKGEQGIRGDRDEEAELRAGRNPWGSSTVSVWIVGADGGRVKDAVSQARLRSAQSRVRALKGLSINAVIVDDASGEDLPPA